MTYLTETRDHARRLTESDHIDDCMRIHRIVKTLKDELDWTLSCPRTDGHDPHEWVGDHGLRWDCPGLCGGCMPDSQRVLWKQIADEIDDHLRPDDDGQGVLL